MKTKMYLTMCLGLLFATSLLAQNRTTVNAMNSEISDSLDLRAIASIFGDSRDLEDFEQRLNNPKLQLSNLDLNEDNQVDYLRVIESIEGTAHLIIIQSVIGKDIYQDVATVEVQKLANNRVQVQVVGDVFMYGTNYIYEPIFVTTPLIYASFWRPSYTAYTSAFYWGYYPSYYTFWNPYPLFRYRNNIGLHINFYNTYNYVNTRNCSVAYTNYYNRRANYYERRHPNRSFSYRNSGYSNRYDYDKSRSRQDIAYSSTIRNISNGNRNNSKTTRSTKTNYGGARNNSVSTRSVKNSAPIASNRNYSQNNSSRNANASQTASLRNSGGNSGRR